MTSDRPVVASGKARPTLAAALLLLPLVAASAERDLRTDPPEATFATTTIRRSEDMPLVAVRLDRDAIPELVGPGGTHRGSPLRQGGVDIAMRSLAFVTGGAATKGDLDGDGDLDLVIAEPCAIAPHAGLENCCAGRVMVFWAPRDLPDLPRRYFDDYIGDWTLFGGCETTELGTRLAAADVNGDGLDDLIAGGLSGWDGFSFTGTCLYGVFGPFPADGSLDLLTSPADFNVCASGSLPSFGESLAAGDFDGDTVEDVAVSGADGIRIFRGQRLVGTVDWSTPDTLIVLQSASRGAPLVGNLPLVARDVDGDGRDDLLMGLASGDGEVDLVLGRTPLPGLLDLNVTPADLAVFGAAGAEFGASVAVGYWTPDASLDLVVGAPSSDGPSGTRPDAGAVIVLDGLESLRGTLDLGVTAATEVLHGVDAGDRLGDGRSGRGLLVDDISGDGIDDIAAWASAARGVANLGVGAVGETVVVNGDPPGQLDLWHSVADPRALGLLAAGVASPWDGAPGLADDGVLHFFRLEAPAGAELTIFVTKLEPSRTVRVSWWDGRPSAVAVESLGSNAAVRENCVRADARSAARFVVTPRDASGQVLGAGLDVRPSIPDTWLPGVPTGGFHDLGNGQYELEVAATGAGMSSLTAQAEGMLLATTASVNFSNTAPSVTASAMPRSGPVGVSVMFTASISDGVAPFSYSWDLDGDGTADSAEVAPQRTYTQSGWYTASVQVTDAAGCGGRGAVSVLVGP